MKRTRICVVSQEEQDEWIRTGVKPLCAGHFHVDLDTAWRWHDFPQTNCFEKVQWVAPNTLLAVREESYFSYELAATVSRVSRMPGSPGGIATVQRVRRPARWFDDLKKCMSHKNIGVPASGAHTRNMKVSEINST